VKIRKIVLVVLSIMAGIVIGMDTGLIQQAVAGEEGRPDSDRCAFMIRKGKESFSRARYGEAKEYFRQAIQADPDSPSAWSYYDLSMIYTVAEQFKIHGRVVTSTAPSPEETATLDSKTPSMPSTQTDEKTTEETPPVQLPIPSFRIVDDEGC
jgi:tetratricopeptide (TPR) repeat protein